MPIGWDKSSMVLLIALLIITFLATYWARGLAQQRGRHINGWVWATVLFPPVVLILWALPPRVAAS